MRKNKGMMNLGIPLVLLLIVGLLFVWFLMPEAQKSSVKNVFNKDSGFITYELYDKDGNLIQPQAVSPLSIVQGTEGVYYMKLFVNIQNTGDVDLESTITDAAPGAFLSSLPTAPVALPVGGSYSWDTGLLATDQFEGMSQPVDFSVQVTSTYDYAGETVTVAKQGSLSLNIEGDPMGDFTVSVESQQSCGDACCRWRADPPACAIGESGYIGGDDQCHWTPNTGRYCSDQEQTNCASMPLCNP